MLSKRIRNVVVPICLVLMLAWSNLSYAAKNVIVMVPDGCSQDIQTLTRLFKGSALYIDGLSTGLVKTHMANSVITGSAAAATAFATGHKTSARFIGVGPKTDDLLTDYTPTASPYVPLASVLEGAKLLGKSTGLVATSRITHATPAAYAAHIEDRDMDNEIMEHMVYNNIDVVFGGGARHLIPNGETYTTSFGAEWSGKRKDGENLMTELTRRGVTFVDSSTGLQGLTSAPAWGLFADSHMDADADRDDLHPTQPSLTEMTAKALELLSQDDDGFFLMVEGSQVDWAGHANDAGWMVTDYLAFDSAVGYVLNWARLYGDTLLLIFPDHNTGALSIGNYSTDGSYTATTIESIIDPMKNTVATSNVVFSKLPESPAISDLKNLFVQYWGSFWNTITDEQAQGIIDLWVENGANAYAAQYPLNEYIAKHITKIGWTTHGHLGGDVPLYAYGPGKPIGLYDNTELAQVTAQALGVDLAAATRQLYVDASTLGTVAIDKTDPQNPVLVLGDCRYPASKDYRILPDNSKETLSGISVYAPQIEKFFICPEQVTASSVASSN